MTLRVRKSLTIRLLEDRLPGAWHYVRVLSSDLRRVRRRADILPIHDQPPVRLPDRARIVPESWWSSAPTAAAGSDPVPRQVDVARLQARADHLHRVIGEHRQEEVRRAIQLRFTCQIGRSPSPAQDPKGTSEQSSGLREAHVVFLVGGR